ncbi:5673_t:CDS:2 [Diversispora eburnea]|uniref:Mediator of RNA polymerase II transcription subunit 1 n=1 Tax=Diversispora eburnea TaxID=1213867 RepID=A0A9N8YLR0_9GLOM|nr:5673_t:CDS:2 [Diversispora eburnea]
MTEDSKKILTLVRELRELIKNAQVQWGIPIKKPALTSDKSQILVANAVHPLGPVDIGLHTEFSRKIEAIRSILTHFRTTTLQEFSQTNVSGTEQLVKKYFSLLKDESNQMILLSEVQENIKICKSLVLDACENNPETFKFLIPQIINFGKQLGLRIYDNIKLHGTSFTMIGPRIVFDIDNLLSQQLSDFKKFELFKKNLKVLVTLDNLSKTNVHSSVDCFLCMKCITNDIKLIYEREYSASENDITKILLDGHGIPSFNMEKVGPSIAYWAPRYRIIETDWNLVRDEFMGKESRSIQMFLPPERNQYLLNENDDEFELLQRLEL